MKAADGLLMRATSEAQLPTILTDTGSPEILSFPRTEYELELLRATSEVRLLTFLRATFG